jgi:nitroreductase
MTLSGRNGSTAVQINYELCSTCTQCIAICPQQALSWNDVASTTYDRARLPSAEQLDELFKERRTTRLFRRKPIERETIEEIVSYGIYAPTNNYTLRVIVVDDPAIMEELDQALMWFLSKIYNLFFRFKVVFNFIRWITPSMSPKDKVKFEHDLERGRTYERLPAATIFIVGDSRIGLSEVSAQYYMYNMILYAQVKGIGSRLRGTGPIFLDRSRAARQRLGLQKHEHILGTLEIGYPAVEFRNKVEGKALPIQWNPVQS